jgi:pantothenate kinase type III
MANAHKQTKRDLLNMLTVDALLGFFTKQARNAVKKGATQGPTLKQIKRYAKECRRQLKQALKACVTGEHFAAFGKCLMARLDPNAVEYRMAIEY